MKIYDVMFLDIGAQVADEKDFKPTTPEVVARASVTAEGPTQEEEIGIAVAKAARIMQQGLNPTRRYAPAVVEIMDLTPKRVVTATPGQLKAALRQSGLTLPGA